MIHKAIKTESGHKVGFLQRKSASEPWEAWVRRGISYKRIPGTFPDPDVAEGKIWGARAAQSLRKGRS